MLHFLWRRLPVLFFLLLFSAALRAQSPTEATGKPLVAAFGRPGRPGTVSVPRWNGSITVVGYAGREVVLEAVPRLARNQSRPARNPSPPPAAAGLHRIGGPPSGVSLLAEEKDNRITITCPEETFADLTIKVPRRCSLQLSIWQKGEILVEDVTGALEVSTTRGRITLKEVGGSAIATSSEGSVLATFKTVTPGAQMAFSSVRGPIDLTFPRKLPATLKLKSDQGAVYSDFDLRTEKTPTAIPRPAQDGTNRLTVDSWTYGQVNGGGASILVQTVRGNIYIRKGK